MGQIYKRNINPIRDFLIHLLLINVDFNDEKIQRDIKETIKNILISVGVYDDELEYLDYKFKIKKNYIKLQPNNFVCALWFIGALPDDPTLILDENRAVVGDYVYKFNRRTKMLSKRKIDN